MSDPDVAIEPERLADLHRRSVEELGLIYDPSVVARVEAAIVSRIRRGLVGEGITYAQLVRESGVPTWVAHRTLLGHLLALVSVQSYQENGVLLGALVRIRDDQPPPTDDFCRVLESLGLVQSRHDREACLETWDLHWKKAVMVLDTW